MKIVVGGYIVGYPLGGMTWHHLNYLLGLVDLGHDVTFLEDGAYLPPFDPVANTYGDPSYGVSYLRGLLSWHGEPRIRWHYRYGSFSDGNLTIDELRSTLRHADLFVAVSGVTPLDWYDLPKRTLVIDTDPVFTQLRMTGDADLRAYYARFTSVATFGRLVGTSACPLPTHGFDWIPTNQPIALDYWPHSRVPADGLLTTVGKWEHDTTRTVDFEGQRYFSSKGTEYEKLIDLPRNVGAALEMRMAGLTGEPAMRYVEHGWKLGDAYAATRDAASFENYIRNALGEFTVAKQIYAGLPSGWFSDRSACFLATGRPVVTQSSGFEQWLPTGEGLFNFTDQNDAIAAIESIRRDPQRHGTAARRIAEQFFDARTVLADLLHHVA
jgi:hypothetical protein